LPVLVQEAPAMAQDHAADFPSGVENVASAEALVERPSRTGLSLRLSRLGLDPSQVVDSTAPADPHLVLVDSGAVTVVVDDRAVAYPAGSAFALRSATPFTLRNDGAEPVDLVVLGLEPRNDPDAAASPSPLLSGSDTVFSAAVDSSLYPARLVLARTTWAPDADTGRHVASGPVGFLIESGALAVTVEGRDERELGPGEDIVFRAGAASRQRNAGSRAATALIGALVPNGLGLFQPAERPVSPDSESATEESSTDTKPQPDPVTSGCGDRPASDAIAIDEVGEEMPYLVWVAWTPHLVVGGDCSAWLFFSAQVVYPDETLGTQKLYAARFDPEANHWRPAREMPGGPIQFGASAVIDPEGTVHLVYSNRASESASAYARLLYATTDDSEEWSDPVEVAPHDRAGHQLSPELLRDERGVLHVVWQDQRNVDEAARRASAANADVFASELGEDGNWSEPVQVSERSDPTTNASRPQLASDGERLVLVWSVYDERSGLDSAARLEWSMRPIDGPGDWSEPRVLVQRGDADIGGRLLDLASDPTGGVFFVYGSNTAAGNTLFTRRLDRGAETWDRPIVLIEGNLGSFPSAAVLPDGTLLVVYNAGAGTVVEVGALTLPPDSTESTTPVILTNDESGATGRPFVAIDGDGDPWVAYFHEPSGQPADAVWCQRNVRLDGDD
jgi:quercetin dioxygenase-like cupin family protein